MSSLPLYIVFRLTESARADDFFNGGTGRQLRVRQVFPEDPVYERLDRHIGPEDDTLDISRLPVAGTKYYVDSALVYDNAKEPADKLLADYEARLQSEEARDA
jgi:hypothetical protein